MFESYRNLYEGCNSFLNKNYVDLLKQNNDTIKKLQNLGYDYALKAISSSEIEENMKKKILFYLKCMNAISSMENTALSPMVVEEAIKTKGQSLLNGFYNFINDFSKNFEVKTYNEKAFTVGKNLAITPGSVVYKNELIELIYYTPSQETNYSSPLLIVPPWINKYYILDLQPHNSLVKFLVDMGFPVFMISWVNPDSMHASKGFTEYLLDGTYSALKVILDLFPEAEKKKINILGYCVGGTLVTLLSAYLKTKNIDILNSATFFATLVDFSEVGELEIFIDEMQISMIENYMSLNGYFDGNHLRMVFNLLKAEDMIAKPFMNNYLMGKDPFPFDILYWNADSTHIPYKLHSDILRLCYLNNLIVKPNGIKIKETPINISEIDIPLCFVGTEEDHIIPWKSMFNAAANKFKGSLSKKFILAGSGHVAGIVNPPVKNKYSYVSDFIKKDTTPEKLSAKRKVSGSWWNEWKDWLGTLSGDIVKSFIVPKKHIIEPAPGTNIKQRIDRH